MTAIAEHQLGVWFQVGREHGLGLATPEVKVIVAGGDGVGAFLRAQCRIDQEVMVAGVGRSTPAGAALPETPNTTRKGERTVSLSERLAK